MVLHRDKKLEDSRKLNCRWPVGITRICFIQEKDLEERTALQKYREIMIMVSKLHFFSHSVPVGEQFGRFLGEDRYTTRKASEWYGFRCI